MTTIARFSVGLSLALVVIGCGANTPDDGLVDGFEPPPVPAGYKRYITPVVHDLQPGQDIMLCQWLDIANADDFDIVDVRGDQTESGHHVALYSSSKIEPIGTSRECTVDDMVSVEFLGAVGGEAVNGGTTVLPEGYVFRQRKGRALMANVHYLNATDEVLQVQSVVDVKTAAPSAERTPVGMTGINVNDFSIPAGATSHAVDAYCTWPSDSSLIMYSNHMHEHGTSAFSEVIHAGGAAERIATDTSWNYEQAFNPRWTRWSVAAPLKLNAGDKLHVHCEWNNTLERALRFPDEMCTGVGFYTESSAQAICDGVSAAD